MIKRVLFVCVGNSDRSPLMALLLAWILKCAGHDVVCESAGIHEVAKSGFASVWGITAAKRFGLDLSGHSRRHIRAVDLTSYDLIVCMNDAIAGTVIEAGVNYKKVYDAQVKNHWPIQFQEDYDNSCMPGILNATYRIISRYWP